MAVDQNELRKVGFTKKQAFALAPALGGASFGAEPINSYAEFARQSAGTAFYDLSTGSKHLAVDAAHPQWVTGPDLALNPDTMRPVVVTSGLFLLTGQIHFSYHDNTGTELAIDAVKGSTQAILGLPQGDDWIQVPFRNTTLINNGWIELASTLYLVEGTELDFVCYADVRKVSDNSVTKPRLNDAYIVLTRYARV